MTDEAQFPIEIKKESTQVEETIIVAPKVFRDDRSFFMEACRADCGDHSWYEFPKNICGYSAMEGVVVSASWRDMHFAAPCPRYSLLENCRLKMLGMDEMQPIDVALQAYLKLKDVAPASENGPISKAVDSRAL